MGIGEIHVEAVEGTGLAYVSGLESTAPAQREIVEDTGSMHKKIVKVDGHSQYRALEEAGEGIELPPDVSDTGCNSRLQRTYRCGRSVDAKCRRPDMHRLREVVGIT